MIAGRAGATPDRRGLRPIARRALQKLSRVALATSSVDPVRRPALTQRLLEIDEAESRPAAQPALAPVSHAQRRVGAAGDLRPEAVDPNAAGAGSRNRRPVSRRQKSRSRRSNSSRSSEAGSGGMAAAGAAVAWPGRPRSRICSGSAADAAVPRSGPSSRPRSGPLSASAGWVSVGSAAPRPEIAAGGMSRWISAKKWSLRAGSCSASVITTEAGVRSQSGDGIVDRAALVRDRAQRRLARTTAGVSPGVALVSDRGIGSRTFRIESPSAGRPAARV